MLFISLLFIILFLFIQPPVEVLRMFSSKPFKHILTVLYRVAFLPKTVTTVISLTGFNTHEYRHYQEQNGTTNSTKEPKHPLVAPRFKFVQRLFCGLLHKLNLFLQGCIHLARNLVREILRSSDKPGRCPIDTIRHFLGLRSNLFQTFMNNTNTSDAPIFTFGTDCRAERYSLIFFPLSEVEPSIWFSLLLLFLILLSLLFFLTFQLFSSFLFI